MNEEYNQGWRAYFNGVEINCCPYTQPFQKAEWELGWLSAQNDDIQGEYFGDYWLGFDDVEAKRNE